LRALGGLLDDRFLVARYASMMRDEGEYDGHAYEECRRGQHSTARDVDDSRSVCIVEEVIDRHLDK
jgi:hypothetical protein